MIPIKFWAGCVARYPKIPKIQQTAIDDFDRNAFDEAIARVDRCQSCHMGADKKGFEDAPAAVPHALELRCDHLQASARENRMHSLPRGPGTCG